MYECKICGKNLYNKITFASLFKINYEIHIECIKKLLFNLEEEVIPIDGNNVIYDYVFKGPNDDYNEEYLWFKYFGRVMNKHMNNGEWSMAIINDKSVQYFMQNFNPYLLINLADFPILIISLKEEDLDYLEAL